MTDRDSDWDLGGEGEGEDASHERWLVSYADFITLLFAFFAVLYATSTRDLEKTQQFQESVKRFLIKAGSFGESGAKIHQGERNNSPIEPPIPTYGQSSPLTQDTFDEVEALVEQEVGKGQRNQYVRDVLVDELGVRLILDSQRIFAGASLKFRPEALAFLDQLAQLLGRVGRSIMIEGHVEAQIPPPPGFPSHWEYSSARAATLVRYLSQRHNMNPSLFIPIGYGSQRPIGKSYGNDRLEVVLLTEDVPL